MTVLSIGSDLRPLAERAAAGDSDSLADLLAELRPAIVRVARLVVGPGTWAAEDAAQDALVDITRGIASLREPGAVRSWAMKIAVSRALKVARRERLKPISLGLRDVPELVAPARDDQLRDTDLKRAFYRLPPRMRAIAILRLHVGLSEAETARLVGVGVGTAKSQLHEARKRLARQLTDTT
jgi:RNA polymerase sigma-70 factor (ECF subfamily)